MPSLKLSVPHKLGAEEAKKRIARLVTDLKKHAAGMISDVQESWNGEHATFSFKAMGFTISGTLDVAADKVDIEIVFPFAALPFKGKVENEITTRARALLA